MAKQRQKVLETVGWLTFPRHAYPNIYLNPERVKARFSGYLGAISEFYESIESSGKASASLKPIFIEAGIEFGGSGQTQVRWDTADPLAQVLLLRANLARNHELKTDARSASHLDFVEVRGKGGILPPAVVLDPAHWQAGGVDADSAAEICEEHLREAGLGTEPDPQPTYWGAYLHTDAGLVVSLLGHGSIIGTDARQYVGATDMSYCIFGQKNKDWGAWTLLTPLHVWAEPPGRPSWG